MTSRMTVRRVVVAAALSTLTGCAMSPAPEPYVPAMKYAVAPDATRARMGAPGVRNIADNGRPELRMADGEVYPEDQAAARRPRVAGEPSAVFPGGAQASGGAPIDDSVRMIPSSEQLPRGYTGPLALGDPGVSSSLWRESRAGNDIFRDSRAWQPMDIVTIVVSERSKGTHDADTETKSKSSVQLAIENLVGLEQQTAEWKHVPDLSSLVNAESKNDFKGEGETKRQAELTARISAVVAEVLPSGLLRVEGEKIIAVNNEEQVMVISGLVRQRDINSNNEIDSAKIAQMRIDYYGKGIVGEAQYGGWLGRILRIIWPF